MRASLPLSLKALLPLGVLACAAASAQTVAPVSVPLGPPPQAAASSLPDLGSSANTYLSRADEYQVGRVMMHNLRQEGELLDDPEISEYLQNLGQRLGTEAADGTQRFQFFMVKDQSFNAFALPGGFIGVNSGLYLQTASESELAGVIAHEVGHVSQRHIARAIQAQSHQSITNIAAMLGAILIGAMSGRGDAAPGLIAMSQGIAMQQQINFTRMEESEADRVGMGYLAAAGFDPNAMANLWSTQMREAGIDNGEIPELLRSHPVDRLRIAEARARAAQLPHPRVVDSPTFTLMRERARVLTAETGLDMRPYYSKLAANGDHAFSIRYGSALAAMRAGDGAAAEKILQPLVEEQPGITMLHAALGQAQMVAGRKEAALKTFAHATTLYPRNVPITVRYAEALMDAGKPEQAHQLLLDLFNNVTPSPEQIQLTALAASAAGDTGDAYYYMSEYHIASGDLMLATNQLDLALAAPRLTEVQRKRFAARRDEIRGYLREQRADRSGTHGPG